MSLEITNQQVIGGEENESPTPVKLHKGYIWDDIYASEIARWKVTWASQYFIHWELITTGAVTNHLVWSVNWTPDLAVPNSSWVQMSLISSASNDWVWWTWLRSVNLHYLDVNLDEQVETVILNWTTAVLTVATDIRFIQDMHIMTYWSTTRAVWNISATNWGVTYWYIKALARNFNSSARRVPRAKRLMIKSVYCWSSSWSAAAWSVVRLVMTYIEQTDFTEQAITIPYSAIWLQDWSNSIMLDQPFAVPSWVVVAFEVTSDKAATISAWYTWYLEDV